MNEKKNLEEKDQLDVRVEFPDCEGERFACQMFERSPPWPAEIQR